MNARRLSLPAWLLAPLLLTCSPDTPETQTQRRAAAAEAPAEVPQRPVDPEAQAWVDSTLARLSLRQRVAQLVMPWISGQSAPTTSAEFQRLIRWAQEDEVGGLIISTGPPDAFITKLNAAQARARVPLLVVTDLETGPGMRLSPGGTYIPPGMALGATGNPELAREAGRITGREARAVGIHMTLGPVLDVNSDPRNPIINVRSFGEDPQAVARLAGAWIAGAREANLQTAGKHFPGHGDTEVDSHIGLAAISGGAERLNSVELVPFQAAVRQGMEGMLVGHIAVTGLEGSEAPPASLSPRIIGGLLREQLGFQGVAITDALNMGAVTRRGSVSEASIQALLAGADILLQPPGERVVIDAVVRAVESGRIPRARIDEATRRVLMAKAAAGLHRGATVNRDAAGRIVGAPAHAEVARRIAEGSIVLARDRNSLVPLRPEVRRILHVTYADAGSTAAGRAMNAALAGQGRQIDEARVSERTTAAEFAALQRRAEAAKLVIASAYVAPREYRASVAIAGGFPGFVERLAAAGKPVVAVSLGSPYLLDAFPSVPAYVLAWNGSMVSQRAAARALLGATPITGRLPVSLPPHHRLGEGIQRPAR